MKPTIVVEKDITLDMERLIKSKTLVAHLEGEFKAMWLAEESANLRRAGVPQPAIDLLMKRFDSCVHSAIISSATYVSRFADGMMKGDVLSTVALIVIHDELATSRAGMKAHAAMTKAAAH